MVKFASGIAHKEKKEINRRPVFWMVDLDLPMSLRESTGITALRPILGEFLMGFYAEPMVGDTVPYEGHRWRIIERVIVPNRHGSKGERKLPWLKVEYLGKAAAVEAGS